MRTCDFCGTPLRGRGHAFVTRKGKLSCARSTTQRTIVKGVDKEGNPNRILAKVALPCAREAGIR